MSAHIGTSRATSSKLLARFKWPTATLRLTVLSQTYTHRLHSTHAKTFALHCNSPSWPHCPSWAPLRSLEVQARRSRHESIKLGHRAFIALGSNLGDRVAMIERACKEMDASGKMRVIRTSSLWETQAMYVLDQDKFVNGACEVRNMSIRKTYDLR